MIQQSPYDIVLMDMQMSVMDGVTATIEIRKLPQYDHIPIVAMTANAMQADKGSCLAAGMVDFVSKPIDPDELWRALLAWVKPQHASAAISAKSSVVNDANASIPTNIAGLNTKLGLKRGLGKSSLYLSMLRKFVTGQKDFAANIETALNAQNWETAELLAHTLKSVAANIGASELQEEADKIETACREKQARSSVDDLLAILTPLLNVIINGLEAQSPTVETTQATQVDEELLKTVSQQLVRLLGEGDSEAAELLEENSALLKTAYSKHYRAIESGVRDFDFEPALEALEQAMNTSA